MKSDHDLAVQVAGTLTGLLAIVIEELELAGSLSRSQITERLQAFLQKERRDSGESSRPYSWLETAIISELLKILIKPTGEPFRLTLVAGTDVERDDPS